jgi:hypothetical protein
MKKTKKKSTTIKKKVVPPKIVEPDKEPETSGDQEFDCVIDAFLGVKKKS